MNDDSPSRKKRRKFPGPAGILPDEGVHESEVDSSQLSLAAATSPYREGPWCLMEKELEGVFGRSHSDVAISRIRTPPRRVALLAGVVRHVDGAQRDPSIVLMDPTGQIRGTLHRDAWEAFGCYIVPRCSVMILKNVSVLTAGSILKRNYLNITLNNIVCVYCDRESVHDKKVTGEDDRFTLDNVTWNEEDVVIVRNNIVKRMTENRSPPPPLLTSSLFRNVLQSSPDRPEDDSVIEDTLSGVRCEDFLDDFD